MREVIVFVNVQGVVDLIVIEELVRIDVGVRIRKLILVVDLQDLSHVVQCRGKVQGRARVFSSEDSVPEG